jgi:neutral ceramidase
MLAAYDQRKPIRQVPYPVQAVRFNQDLAFLALGGEVVVDYSLRAKREFAGENLVVAGYCNDVMCYIPSQRVLREGGYEPVESMIYYGMPGPFADTVEEQVFQSARKVLKRVGARPDPRALHASNP